MSMNMSDNKTHVSGVRHGTPLYISPEILHNGKASKVADVLVYVCAYLLALPPTLPIPLVRTGSLASLAALGQPKATS